MIFFIKKFISTSLLVIMCSAVVTSISTAAPREIIIIRHADKLDQTESGPTLSAQGIMRSIKFAFYFMEKFGEPDFIVAADDQKENGKEIAIRSIQTVAPLANIMQMRYPEHDFPIIHPYPSDSYQQLADHLLNDEKYDDKLVLICWSHQRIAKLATALGVTHSIPAWPRNDYDTVYILDYDAAGNFKKFAELKKQFPVRWQGSWAELRDKILPS